MEELTNYKQLYEQKLNEIIELNNKIIELSEHLKKYTSHKGSKVYYQKNKDNILEKNKEYVRTYKDNLSSEKIKEYNKRAYENRKKNMPKCIKCNLFAFNNKQEQLCNYCDPNSKKLYATKEMKVVSFLNNNNIQFTHNKSIGFECGNYRPDILIDCNTHFIVIEVDENQHESYDINCEMARMNNIYISLGLPVIYYYFFKKVKNFRKSLIIY